jgi:hypothetical protein
MNGSFSKSAVKNAVKSLSNPVLLKQRIEKSP